MNNNNLQDTYFRLCDVISVFFDLASEMYQLTKIIKYQD